MLPMGWCHTFSQYNETPRSFQGVDSTSSNAYFDDSISATSFSSGFQSGKFSAVFALQRDRGSQDEQAVIRHDYILTPDNVIGADSAVESDSESGDSSCEDESISSEFGFLHSEKESLLNGSDFSDDIVDFNSDSSDDLEWVDDRLFSPVCEHFLDQEEKAVGSVRGEISTISTETAGETMQVSEGNCHDDIYIIFPPPEAVFDTHDEAEHAVHEWTLRHGFNVSRRRVRYLKGSDTIWARNYECDRAGRPKCTQRLIEGERQRQMRGSKRSGRPIRLKICAVSKTNVEGPWKIVHTRLKSKVHNHPPSDDIRVHAAHRQRAASHVTLAPPTSMHDFIDSQTAAGIQVAKIRASILHKDPTSLIRAKDIGNSKLKARHVAFATMTPMEALFDLLWVHKFYYRYEVDPVSNELLYLLWAHLATLRLYVTHSDVLVMYGAFKTNKYDLPHINVISMTGMNTVNLCWFLKTFRALLDELAMPLPTVILTDRELACLNALAIFFSTVPSIICRWHFNQNVVAKVRSVLDQVAVVNPLPGQDKYENTWQTQVFMEFFYKMVESESESKFEFRCSQLHMLSPVSTSYLDEHWWKFKTKLVHCWTNRHKHYGYRDTSAVEVTHAQYKRWLHDCNGDMYTVFKRLLPWWVSCASAVKERAVRDATILPYLLQHDRYAQVGRVITVWGLRATDILWNEAMLLITGAKTVRVCSSRFRTVHGRPCVHEIIAIIKSNRQSKLLPSRFDAHWWIYRDRMQTWQPRIREPASLRKIRRVARSHKANHGASGNARLPTFAERVGRDQSYADPASHFTTLLQKLN